MTDLSIPRNALVLFLPGLLVLAGERDESFYAERYEPTIAPRANATVTVLPGVTHLGLVVNPMTAEAIEAWLGRLASFGRDSLGIPPAL